MKNLAFALVAILLTAQTFVDNGTSQIVRGIQSTEDFGLSATPKTVIVSGSSSSTITVKDAVVSNFTSATINSLSDLKVSVPVNSAFPGTQSISNLTPSVCTFNSAGVSTYVGAGTSIVNVSLAGIGTRQVSFATSQTVGTSTNTFSSFASGSLGAALTTGATGVNTLLTGLTPGSSVINLYTTYDTTIFAFTRNPSVWTAGMDWSCQPAATSLGQPSKYHGCLVSPRHLIGAAHVTMANGTTLYFCDNSQPGVVSSRTISSSLPISGTDIVVYYLSSDVPAGINFAKVLPSNYQTASYVPSMTLGYGYAAVYTNQDNNLYTADVVSTTSPLADAPSWVLQQSADATRGLWYTAVINGDSGSPVMMDIGGSAVLLGTQFNSDKSTHSYFNGVSDNITAINAAMTTSGGGYSLTTVSLSGVNTY